MRRFEKQLFMDSQPSGERLCIKTLGDQAPTPMLIKLPLIYIYNWKVGLSYENNYQYISQGINMC